MGSRLEWALLNYFIDQHLADGYEMVVLPLMLEYRCGETAGQFPKFADDQLQQAILIIAKLWDLLQIVLDLKRMVCLPTKPLILKKDLMFLGSLGVGLFGKELPQVRCF